MAIVVTTWTPAENCGCVINYAWDNTLPQEKRFHVFHSSVKTCGGHAALWGSPDHLSTLFAINRGNQGAQHVQEPLVAAYGTEQFTWRFVGDSMQCTPRTPLSAHEKVLLQSQLDVQFGVGKVTVQ